MNNLNNLKKFMGLRLGREWLLSNANARLEFVRHILDSKYNNIRIAL